MDGGGTDFIRVNMCQVNKIAESQRRGLETGEGSLPLQINFISGLWTLCWSTTSLYCKWRNLNPIVNNWCGAGRPDWPGWHTLSRCRDEVGLDTQHSPGEVRLGTVLRCVILTFRVLGPVQGLTGGGGGWGAAPACEMQRVVQGREGGERPDWWKGGRCTLYSPLRAVIWTLQEMGLTSWPCWTAQTALTWYQINLYPHQNYKIHIIKRKSSDRISK